MNYLYYLLFLPNKSEWVPVLSIRSSNSLPFCFQCGIRPSDSHAWYNASGLSRTGGWWKSCKPSDAHFLEKLLAVLVVVDATVALVVEWTLVWSHAAAWHSDFPYTLDHTNSFFDMSSMLTKIWPSAGIDAVFAILIVIKTECKYTTFFAIISLSDEKTDNN